LEQKEKEKEIVPELLKSSSEPQPILKEASKESLQQVT
jgi:hypothetical protein